MDQSELKEKALESRSPFTPIEWKAIEDHRRALCHQRGQEVATEEAISDWLKNCAPAWREGEMRKALQSQLQEMLKHKWIESEKVGRDLGTMAIEDWIKKYADLWRKWWEEKENNQSRPL